MLIDELRERAFAKPGAVRDEPWGEGHLVAKVGDKIFAFLASEDTLGVKCGTREEADTWLDEYPAEASRMAYIGQHGWNNLRIDGEISREELVDALDRSYELVAGKLPKKSRPEGWDQAR